MSYFTSKKFKNVCPRNCYSSCTMLTHVENDHLVHLEGDPHHPYTKGKLCSKGYAYTERNEHDGRLKFPYYQEVKGSGRFKQITWEMAFDLIIAEMLNIYHRRKSFAFYKGTGNIGVHHNVIEEFFACLGGTTPLHPATNLSTGTAATQYRTDSLQMPNPRTIKNASMVIIWGANPAATNVHLIPFIIEAKARGAKLVVIDPMYTQTAEMADLYIQLRPSTDGALANLLIKGLIEANAIDKHLGKQSIGLDLFLEKIKNTPTHDYLSQCDIEEKAIKVLIDWLLEAGAVSHIIGNGVQHHSNGVGNFRSIEALAVLRGEIGKYGGGIFFRHHDPIFNNQQLFHSEFMDEKINHIPIEMVWISCANPLVQNPNSRAVKSFLQSVPFVVTVEQFMTPTAKMSNLVLPTTSHFEELDIVTNSWHNEIALNEKAIPPYFQSRSEWWIMTELATRLNRLQPNLSSFPIYSSEEEYLNAQFNERVYDVHGVRSVSDLRKNKKTRIPSADLWERSNSSTKPTKYQFHVEDAVYNCTEPIPLFAKDKSPTDAYPFWLITPHHPYKFNSQFQFLKLAEENEAFVGIHPKVGEKLGIFNGEVIKVFNNQANIGIKAIYSNQVPEDIVFIYQGWHPDSEVIVNQLIPVVQMDRSEKVSGARGIAYYDAFVNIAKL